jgi:23S rRNA pseudouridine2605 synthase
MGSSIIRELFEHLGYQVVKVDCVALAHLTKKDLPRGRYRHLNDDEISLFSML